MCVVRACLLTISGVLAGALTACSAETDGSESTASARTALVLAPEPGADFGDETEFSRSVAARYSEPMGGESIADDLRAHGFVCEELAPVEARPDYSLFSCSRAEPAGACFDTYVVRIAHDPQSDDLATAEGGYARRCLGAVGN